MMIIQTALTAFALGLLVGPFAAGAQQRAKVLTIGFLVPATGPYIGTPTAVYEAFRLGLRNLGYVEGRNISLEYRSSSDRAQLADLAADLVRLNVDVIVAAGVAVYPAKTLAERIPVVFGFSGDPSPPASSTASRAPART